MKKIKRDIWVLEVDVQVEENNRRKFNQEHDNCSNSLSSSRIGYGNASESWRQLNCRATYFPTWVVVVTAYQRIPTLTTVHLSRFKEPNATARCQG